MDTLDEMRARRDELQAVVAEAKAAMVTEMGLTDDSSDAEWDALSERMEAEVPEYVEISALWTQISDAVEAEDRRAVETARAARASTPTCPKHHVALTLGRCDECDDWDH